jgi:hypothetical protein
MLSQADKAQKSVSESDPAEEIQIILGSAGPVCRNNFIPPATLTMRQNAANPPLHCNMNPLRAKTAQQYHGAVMAVLCPIPMNVFLAASTSSASPKNGKRSERWQNRPTH